ncbi:hypothetical protein ACHQM5_002370 [Ranunculus cassubicifolius]
MEKSMICVVIMVFFVVASTGTMEDDEKDCAEQLANLAACIPYVSGTADAPTKKCCEDTMKVKNDKPKCLCVLIKESTDPAMGLPVNTTLAIKMPSVCKIDAKVSDCPTILKLAPDSPDAKIFKDAGGATGTPSTASPATTDTPATTTSTTPATTSAGSGSKLTPTSSDGAKSIDSLFMLVVSMVCFSATAWMIM